MKHFQQEREATARPVAHRVYDHEPSAGGMENRKSGARGSRFRRLINMMDSNFWLLVGMTLGIAVLIMAWWIVSGEGPDGIRLFDKSRQASEQTQEQADVPKRQAVEQLGDQLSGLVDRVNMLTDSINYLESKLIRAHVLTDSIISAEQRASSAAPKQFAANESARRVDELPPTAAGQTARGPEPAGTRPAGSAGIAAASRQSTENASPKAASTGTTRFSPQRVASAASPDAVPNADSVTEPRTKRETDNTEKRATFATAARTPAAKQLTAVSAQQEQWVVNLSSSPSKADADRFAVMAQSRGIETQQQHVTVKGKDYWRVQTTGFSTASEAQDYAGVVRQKLGLQNVWITRR